MERVRYNLPLKLKLIHYSRPIIKLLLKIAVPIFAIWGKYPPLMLTPDDKVSPFGSGTTPSASREPTQMKIYAWGTKTFGPRFGRWLGDVVWLGWRNSGYGIAYYLKPEWLKDRNIKYEELDIQLEGELNNGVVWLRQPDGTYLWETTRRFWFITLITGYRLTPIYSGAIENRERLARGDVRAPRPAFHPNMDGRPLVSIRTNNTL
jgi:hypothetical protein